MSNSPEPFAQVSKDLAKAILMEDAEGRVSREIIDISNTLYEKYCPEGDLKGHDKIIYAIHFLKQISAIPLYNGETYWFVTHLELLMHILYPESKMLTPKSKQFLKYIKNSIDEYFIES